MTRTLKVVLAYEGTEFVGWQRQATGRSVQESLEDALSRIEGRRVPVVGAGRTDAGVHALGQVASCELTSDLPLTTLHRALNANLPSDVRVLNLEEASEGFNARFAARSKTYRYRIFNTGVMSPFERRFAWHLPRALDVDAMRAAAAALKGHRDFAAFQATGSPVSSTIRIVSASDLRDESADGCRRIVTYDIIGNGFLRQMVRSIVGTLVEVGSGRRTPDSMEELLESRDRNAAGPTAPAHGLYLVRVEYGDGLPTGANEGDDPA